MHKMNASQRMALALRERSKYPQTVNGESDKHIRMCQTNRIYAFGESKNVSMNHFFSRNIRATASSTKILQLYKAF